jgi:opacity protein-like surface antigen
MTKKFAVAIMVLIVALFSEVAAAQSGFYMYGKVGLVGWEIEFKDISSAFDTSGKDFLYGAGLRWSIDDHWKVFAEYKVEKYEDEHFAIPTSDPVEAIGNYPLN